MYSIQHDVIKFISDLRQAGGDASMDMFQHMIDANEKLMDDFKEEFGVTNDQELQEIINFIKDLIIGKVNIKGFGFDRIPFMARCTRYNMM
jgi:hypothetical protein